jgi:hypothetical protein
LTGTATTPTSLRAVAALAVVKVSWDDNKDYIANFIPIIAHCIREAEADAVSASQIQELIHSTFSLRIPLGPLETILHRMAREGLLRRDNHIYVRDDEALEASNLGPVRDCVLREEANVVDRLIEFAASLGRNWNEEQAERALLSYVELIAEPILGAVVEGDPIVELPKGNGEGTLVTSRFVLELWEREPQAFDYLVTVVKGSMLANVLFMPAAFGGGRSRLDGVDVYLDTPVVLRACGYAEKQYCKPAAELIELLKAEGARLRIFEHTRVEVQGVLDGAAVTYHSGTQGEPFPGDVVDYFAAEAMSRSDVAVAIAELDKRIEAHGFEVLATPDYSEKLNLPEKELEAILREHVRYRRHETMVRDLKSLTAIHRLREAEVHRQIEGCRALFVTTNTSLAHASKEFFRSHYGRAGVPICMRDAALAALAWLMNPHQAPDLPRRQIIATSYAALNPPEAVWRKYLREIRKLNERGEISDQQVGLLLFSPDARLELMNQTSGDPDAYVHGTAAQVLAHAEQAARAEVESMLKQERARCEEMEAAVHQERQRAELEAQKATDIAVAHGHRRAWLAHQVAAGISWISVALAGMLLALGAGLATQGLFPASWARAIPFATALVLLALLAGLASSLSGWNLFSSRRKLAAKLERPIAHGLDRLLTPAKS